MGKPITYLLMVALIAFAFANLAHVAAAASNGRSQLGSDQDDSIFQTEGFVYDKRGVMGTFWATQTFPLASHLFLRLR